MSEQEDRMVDDLSDEEYNDYEANPENWQDVTNNTVGYYRESMEIDDDE